MYQAAIEVLADPDAVVFVEGWVKENPDTGFVTEIEVADFRLAPEFSVESYQAMLGTMPDFTGNLTTAEYIDRQRDGHDA